MIHETLYLSPQQYAYVLEQWARLSRIRPDGSVDDGVWVAWVMSRFNLMPFKQYKLVVEK